MGSCPGLPGSEEKTQPLGRHTWPFTELLAHGSHQGAGEPRYPGGSGPWERGRRVGALGGPIGQYRDEV